MGRTLRWGTLIAAALVVALWASGTEAHYQRTLTTPSREVAIYARWGGVMVIRQDVDNAKSEWDAMREAGYYEWSFGQQRLAQRLTSDPAFDGAVDRLSLRRRIDLDLSLTHQSAQFGLWPPRLISHSEFGTSALQVPYWLITAALAGVSGSLFLLAYFRSRRAKAGHCQACNYSLAGLSPTAACPECGVARMSSGAMPGRIS